MEDSLHGEFILNKREGSEDKKDPPHTPAIKHHKRKPHFYTAYEDYPSEVTFSEQEEGEEVVLLLRRHFITNLPWIVFSLFLIILPVFFPLIIRSFPFPQLSPSTVILMLAFYYLIIMGFVLLNFTLWYFHVGLITTLRVLDIDLAGILYRQVTVTRHENVEDVTYSQTGFRPSLFNYGNVHVQTAGTQENVEFDRVPRPSKVADTLSDLVKPV